MFTTDPHAPTLLAAAHPGEGGQGGRCAPPLPFPFPPRFSCLMPHTNTLFQPEQGTAGFGHRQHHLHALLDTAATENCPGAL